MMIDILFIFLMMILNGVLVCAEISLVSCRKNILERMASTNKSALRTLALSKDPSLFLSSVQIGITTLNLVAGILSGERFAAPLALYIQHLIHGQNSLCAENAQESLWIRFVAFTIVTVIITYISILFGELIPKNIAVRNPETVAIRLTPVIDRLSTITSFFVKCLSRSASFWMKLLKQDQSVDYVTTTEDIQHMIEGGLRDGTLDSFEHQVLNQALHLGDQPIRMVMTPRVEMIFLDLDDGDEYNQNKILLHKRSYYPVIDAHSNQFNGMLYIKDMLEHLIQNTSFELKDLVKPSAFVVEHHLCSDVLKLMKSSKTSALVVVDEYGSVAGIATLTDILEYLIGEIQDGDHRKYYDMKQIEDGSWLCSGIAPIDALENKLNIQIRSTDQRYETLAGFLIDQFKRLPEIGESIVWGQLHFRVIDLDGQRIDQVQIRRLCQNSMNEAVENHDDVVL